MSALGRSDLGVGWLGRASGDGYPAENFRGLVPKDFVEGIHIARNSWIARSGMGAWEMKRHPLAVILNPGQVVSVIEIRGQGAKIRPA